MIRMLTGCFNHGQLLGPWQHGAELDDAVFRVAATFPMRAMRQHVYKVAGDDIYESDPNAFVQRLSEETGISHVWEPIRTRISEGGWSYSRLRAGGTPLPDPEREATHDARELLWAVWSKCRTPYQRLRKDEDLVEIVAILFADFVIDNIGIAREFMSMNGAEGRPPLTILLELERRAYGSEALPE